MWEALQKAQGQLRLCSDSSYVVDTLQKREGEEMRVGAPHLGLWKRIWEQRHRIVEAKRIKAHLAREDALAQRMGYSLVGG